MDGLSQQLDAYVVSPRAGKIRTLAKPRVGPWANHIALLAQTLAFKARTASQAACSDFLSRLGKQFPSLAWIAPPDPVEEPDPIRAIMDDFEKLGHEQQDKVAKNLALLWNSFTSVFGGVTAFQSASPAEQRAYVEKLEAAAHRMEAAKGTEAAFHYVTVELIRQYIAFLQIGSTDQRAVALARLVAPLIDRGHKMTAEPTIYSLKS